MVQKAKRKWAGMRALHLNISVLRARDLTVAPDSASQLLMSFLHGTDCGLEPAGKPGAHKAPQSAAVLSLLESHRVQGHCPPPPAFSSEGVILPRGAQSWTRRQCPEQGIEVSILLEFIFSRDTGRIPSSPSSRENTPKAAQKANF